MFNNELELQKKFISIIEEKKKENEFISEEFNARFGNVDIIKVKYNNYPILTKEQAKILSNISSARIVGLLHKNSPRKLEYLIKITGYEKEYILSKISKLKKEKIIIEREYQKYVISNQFVFPKLYFSAYEAKLTDWKKAISQALKNKNFASESYIVMPLKKANNLISKNNNIFNIYNIGLIGVTDNSIIILHKPKSEMRNRETHPMLISSVAKFLLLEKQVI